MKRKKKICVKCEAEKYIYAKGKCGFCYKVDYAKQYQEKQKMTPKNTRKRIKPISDKKAEELKVYRKNRDVYMRNHPACEAKLSGCQIKSTDLHHKKGRASFDALTNPKWFLAVCRKCHNRIDHELSLEDNLTKGFKVLRSK